MQSDASYLIKLANRLVQGIFLPLFFVFFAAVSLLAAEPEITMATRTIFNYNRFSDAFIQAGIFEKSQGVLQSLNRISVFNRFSDFTVKAEYEMVSSHFSSNANLLSSWAIAANNAGMKAFNTRSNLLESSQTFISGELERLEVNFSSGRTDFQLGRQPISFGTSHFISVADILAPFQPGYLDGSFKPGIDALRIRRTAGDTGEAEIILAAADANAENTVIGRHRDTYNGFDLEICLGRFRRRNFATAAFEGERRRYNLWGELAVFDRHNNERSFGGVSRQVATAWVTGAERSTGKGWRHGLAIMHHDFGARKVDELAATQMTSPYKQGWVHLAASDYLFVNTRREMNPLATLNLNVLHNLRDGSNLFQPVMSISTGDESDLAIFAWLNTGPRPVFTKGALLQRSEFGSFSNGIGLIYRLYFKN